MNPELLSVAQRILDTTNIILVENQVALEQLFYDPAELKGSRVNLARLLNVQRHRGSFGEWQAYLETALTHEKHPQVRKIITELLNILSDLHKSLYSYAPQETTFDSYADSRGNKGMVYRLLDEDIPIKLIRDFAWGHLRQLRDDIEHIGSAVGRLKALSTKNQQYKDGKRASLKNNPWSSDSPYLSYYLVSFVNLRNILAFLYPDEASVRRVAYDAHLNVTLVDFSSNTLNRWHAILLEAEKANKIEDVFSVVLREYGTNTDLRTACDRYRDVPR